MPEKSVYDISTKHDIVEGAPNRTLESAILIMGTKKFRRLPITKLGKIRGIITVTDIIRAISAKGLPEAFDEEIQDWMTKIPKTVDPDTPILDAAKMMSGGNFGSLLIVDHGSDILKAIITERDILKYYKDKEWDAKISDVDEHLLTDYLVKVQGSTSLEQAIVKMDEGRTHRVLIFEDEKLTGILTANDITSLCSREREEISHNANFLKSITADFVATTDVHTFNYDDQLTDAIKLMCERGIGSVPIIRDGEIMGIFSERSLVHYLASQ